MSEPMISLKRYLYADVEERCSKPEENLHQNCAALLSAYCASLADIAESGAKACPALAQDLEKGLLRAREVLSANRGIEGIQSSESSVRALLREWGTKAAQYYQEKSGEIKDLLLVMTRTAESLGHRDEHYLRQLDAITAQLESIATLEDLSRIRVSIEESARELKTSIARIAVEDKAVIDHLRVEVSTYRSKLERAEYIASRDALTGIASRSWIEEQIRAKIEAGSPFSILLIDIRGFGRINTEYGDLVGDVLLKEFAKELRSSCRFSDLVARWGGDEFLVVMDCAASDARDQLGRLHSWICGPYSVRGRAGQVRVRLDVSVGMGEHRSGEDLQTLLERVDADLCEFRETVRSRMSA